MFKDLGIGVRAAAVAAAVLAATATSAATAQAQTPIGVDRSCVEPAGDPAPGTREWIERDTRNQYCASLRNRDQLASPAFGFGNLTQGAALYAEQMADQAGDPTNPRGGITTLIPGAKAADPFRTIKRWTEAGRGRVEPVSFKSLDGATLRGHVFVPPARLGKPKRGYPGVVITDGSVQAYEELYFWAAQDLAEAGYMVMTYDVQGQGDSDLFPEDCTPQDCPGVPYQQDHNFFQGAQDSLNFFLSEDNPYFTDLDRRRIGLAGHSLGARAVSHVGQCDRRVKAIVAWDNLQAIRDCDGVTIADEHRSDTLLHAPALGITNDYGFWTQPTLTPPNPEAKQAGYKQVRDAGLDAQTVALRAATHLAYTYIPLVFQSNQLGERMASYYTRAWFDLHLRGKRKGFRRLTAERFDASADKDIGAGTYDPAKADPADPYAGNVPYAIEGIDVRDAVSFYYRSSYSLRDPRTGRRQACEDMRDGCPAPAAKSRAKTKAKAKAGRSGASAGR
jgi:dienelactone hydrolase